MSEYIVSRDVSELPKGSFFIVLPSVEVLPGQLTLIEVEGRMLILGRLHPGEIYLPGRVVDISGVECRVVGPVVPVEMTIKTITNLPEAEYERFLESPFPHRLDS